jgi:tetratricopeptide (TPR) repeat protein
MNDFKEYEQHLLLKQPFDIVTEESRFQHERELKKEHLRCCELVNQVVLGNFVDILKLFQDTALDHFTLVESISVENDFFMAMKSFVLCYLEDEESNKSLAMRTFEVLLLGIIYLELYCQCNYTGPELSRIERDLLDARNEEERKAALLELECDGVLAHHTADMPHLLLFSHLLFTLMSEPTRGYWKTGITLSADGQIVPPVLDLSNQFRQELVSTFQTKFPSLSWWNCRASLYHCRILLNSGYDSLPTLWNESVSSIKKSLLVFGCCDENYQLTVSSSEPISHYENHQMNSSNWTLNDTLLASGIWLEWGLACHFFDFGDNGKKKFQIAKEIIHLDTYLTAALGRRVKYQREDIAQLYLYAKSSIVPQLTQSNDGSVVKNTVTDKELVVREGENTDEYELGKKTIQETQEGEEVAVREILLDSVNTGYAENIVLEGGPQFSSSGREGDENNKEIDFGGALHPFDQIIILALCLDVSNSNPVDGLTNEEMTPYIEKVLKQSNDRNWMIYSTALLERSWIEFEKRKTADRALLQIQALIDQHSTKLSISQSSYKAVEESAKNYERLQYIYQLIYPSQFEMKKDLAMRYLKCQVFMSALNYFRELEMWDEVVACYQLMNKPYKAEIIVREQLKISETPYMLTTLGDLTTNEDCYERAWTLSRGRFARAKRTLGKICYDRGDFATAIQHLSQALTIQPLVHTAWYLKGICCMRAEEWVLGIESFIRCVQLENEVGEAWTNLAAIYMRQATWLKAYHSLTEAMKVKNDDFRILENMLTVTLALKKWKESIMMMNKLIDLRFKSLGPGQQHSTQIEQLIHFKELSFLSKLLPTLYWRYRESDPMTVSYADEQESTTAAAVASASSVGKMDSENEDSDLVLPNLPAFMETQKREMEEERHEQTTASTVSSELARKKKTNEIELLKIRSENLIQDFEKLLNKIVLTLRSDASVCDIIAEFNFYLRKYRITYDYRIKQVRKRIFI